MNRTSPFALQTDNNKNTMSPILQCDISDKMTIIKHSKTIKNHHKFRRNKDSDLRHESFKLNELNSSRKIASIIHETEDNIHEILKLNATEHDDIHFDPSYHHHHHHHHRYAHRSSSHRNHKMSKPSRHSSTYHANSHRAEALNHAPYSKHSLHSIAKRSPPPPPAHGVFLDDFMSSSSTTQSNEKRKRGKKRKRDLNIHSEDMSDDTMCSHHSTQPRKRRKKSVDKPADKNKRHRTQNNASSSFSSSSSCSSSSSSSSYHAKSKRTKKKSKENHRTKKRKRDHSESDDNRKKEKHKEEKEETEQKTQHEIHLSPSPSLSISSLTKQNIKRAQSPYPSSFTSKSRSRSRSKTRGRKHNNSNSYRTYHNPSCSNTDPTPPRSTRSRSRSTHSTSSSSSSTSSNSSSTETTTDQSMANLHKPKRKRKIIRERGRYGNKTRHISSSKRHYESHGAHNHDKCAARDTDSDSDSCSSDSDSASSSSSSSTSSSEENTDASDMEARDIKNKKRDRKYRSSASSSSKDKHKDAQKLPTTRNLLLSGRFYFERMNEEEIGREIRYRFENEKLQIEFWKYTIYLDGASFCRHLDCISVSFETSQQCQDKLSRFVEGFIDLSHIGNGINVSLDQYKSRAKKYHEKHVKKQQEIAENILGKKHYHKIKKEHHRKGKEHEMQTMGRWYWLPLPTEPLQAFRRPLRNAKKVDVSKTKKVKLEVIKTERNDTESDEMEIREPPLKKMKLSKRNSRENTVNIHRTSSSIKSMTSSAASDDLKSSKDILNLMGKIEKKGQKSTRSKSGWKERETNKLDAIDLRLKQKKKAAIIQSKKMIEKHQHSLKSAAIKVKTSKHVTPKMKPVKTEQAQPAQINIKKEERTKKHTKKRKHSEMVSETAINVNNISTTNNTTQSKHIRSKKIKARQQKTGTWRDYLYLYNGKESLAQLHFECMEQFKRELIERCVEEEYIRIMELRKKKQEKQVKIATISHNKFESSTESTPENTLKTHNIPKKKVTQESETSSDESSEDRIKKNKITTIHVNDNDNDYEINIHKLRDKLQTLSTIPSAAKKCGEDLATPQSPSNSQTQLHPKYPNIQPSYNTSSSSVNSTPTNTPAGNPFPINLPQISFNAPHYAPAAQRQQPPPPVIKSLFPTPDKAPSHLSVSQPISATYPSSAYNAAAVTPQHSWYAHQNAAPQYMPLYSAPMGSIPYQYIPNQHGLPALNHSAAQTMNKAPAATTPKMMMMPAAPPPPPALYSFNSPAAAAQAQQTQQQQAQTPQQQLLLSSHPQHHQLHHQPHPHSVPQIVAAANDKSGSNNKGAFSMNKMPNFDISAPPKQMYCDTVSSLSNTSNTSTNISSSHSITSIATATTSHIAMDINAMNTAIKITPERTQKNKNELISKNGHWIIRKHASGCARTEGFYSLAPSKQRRKHRHLASTTSAGRKKETVVFGENARNLRLHKRRSETSHNYHKMNTLPFRQKNIQFGKSSIHSWGVFALEEINAEEMVVEYIGEYITEKYANLREKLYDFQGYDDYMFRVEDDLIIDATKKGNLARFINHSCDPNCYTRIIQVNNTPRVVIYSKRIIKAGEELTYDYKFPIEEDKIQCLCGSKNCRGTLN